MSTPADQMELREADIVKHYEAALGLLDGFDHTPRVAKPGAAPAEKSSGIGTRRRFRSTTPGMVTRSTARPEGVRLIERIEGVGEDALPTALQAGVLQGLRQALAIAFAVSEQFAERTGLDALKRDNLAGGLAAGKKTEFSELLAAEALIALHVFGNAAAFLLAAHASEVAVEIGEVEELLTDNAPLALQGALWELDQDLEKHASDEARTVATVLAFAEQLMEKVALRASTAPRLEAFTASNWKVEADEFSVSGFTPRAARQVGLARDELQDAERSRRQPHRQVSGDEAV